MAEEGEQIRLPLLFLGLEDAPIVYANQFVVQFSPDGFTLTVGQFAPPMLLGEPSERLEQARQLSYIPVRTLGRFAIAPEHLKRLIAALQTNLATFEQAEKRTGNAGTELSS